jgi:hypothetical protein
VTLQRRLDEHDEQRASRGNGRRVTWADRLPDPTQSALDPERVRITTGGLAARLADPRRRPVNLAKVLDTASAEFDTSDLTNKTRRAEPQRRRSGT